MSLTMIITLMVGAWLLAAACLLWGMLRIARRHRPAAAPSPRSMAPAPVKKPRRPAPAVANAH
ncbi:hypothetical protein [Pseudomonas sp. NPDC007930]|uniref:hypothetical protein n=1 Tax=Pseudomonas sp. NPDC007930 TaxID=3364417 RepID=UPI0036E99F5A